MTATREALNTATTTLMLAGIDTAALDARVLLQHVLGVPPEWLVSHAHDALSEAQLTAYDAVIARRATREPVAHILGYKDFFKYRFSVSSHVLTPRPDSETLIEAVLRAKADHDTPLRILDLGTGSGCLLLSLLKEYPNASGLGVDISDEALHIAALNAEALGVASRAQFRKSSWCANLPAQTFDIIVSNPPYIPTRDIVQLESEVRSHEPHLALDGGEDGLNCYRTLFNQLPKHMHSASVCFMEVGVGQAPTLLKLAETKGFNTHPPVYDLAGIARVLGITPTN